MFFGDEFRLSQYYVCPIKDWDVHSISEDFFVCVFLEGGGGAYQQYSRSVSHTVFLNGWVETVPFRRSIKLLRSCPFQNCKMVEIFLYFVTQNVSCLVTLSYSVFIFWKCYVRDVGKKYVQTVEWIYYLFANKWVLVWMVM